MSLYTHQCKACIIDNAELYGGDSTKACLLFSNGAKCWSGDHCRKKCGDACGVEKVCSEVLAVPEQPTSAPSVLEGLQPTPLPADESTPIGTPCTTSAECSDACVFESGEGRCQDSNSFDSLGTPCVPGSSDCTCLVTATTAVCVVAKEANKKELDAATIGIIVGVSVGFVLVVALAAYVLLRKKPKPPVAKVISRGKDEGEHDVDKEKANSSKARPSGHVLNPQDSVTVL